MQPQTTTFAGCLTIKCCTGSGQAQRGQSFTYSRSGPGKADIQQDQAGSQKLGSCSTLLHSHTYTIGMKCFMQKSSYILTFSIFIKAKVTFIARNQLLPLFNGPGSMLLRTGQLTHPWKLCQWSFSPCPSFMLAPSKHLLFLFLDHSESKSNDVRWRLVWLMCRKRYLVSAKSSRASHFLADGWQIQCPSVFEVSLQQQTGYSGAFQQSVFSYIPLQQARLLLT